MKKPIGLVAALVILTAPATSGAEEDAAPQTLRNGTMLCVSAETFREAAETIGAAEAAQRGAVRAAYYDAQKCMTVDEEAIEEMLAPFVKVMERRGDVVRIGFSVEVEDRIELLHRKVAHLRYVGWTGQANLINYYEWLTGKPQN